MARLHAEAGEGLELRPVGSPLGDGAAAAPVGRGLPRQRRAVGGERAAEAREHEGAVGAVRLRAGRRGGGR